MAEEKRREILHIAKTQQLAVQEPPAEERRDPDAKAPVATPELNPRNRAAAEIAARSNIDRDAEAKETIPPGEEDARRDADPEDPEIRNAAGDTDPQPLPSAPAVEAAPAAAPSGFDTEAEYDLIVDGKPIKVKGSQIIDTGRRSIQKEVAADQRLEMASRLLMDAQARAAQPPSGAPPAAPDKSFLDIAQEIQFGTTEQAAARLEKFRADVIAAATKEAAKVVPGISADQLAFQKSVDFVQSEYADLLADPYLKPLFFSEETRRRKAGDRSGYTDLYKSIGEDLRKHFNRPKVGAPAAPAPTLVQRREAKEAAPAAPKLASVRLSGGEAKKPATREEIIARMQESRGMNALTKH